MGNEWDPQPSASSAQQPPAAAAAPPPPPTATTAWPNSGWIQGTDSSYQQQWYSYYAQQQQQQQQQQQAAGEKLAMNSSQTIPPAPPLPTAPPPQAPPPPAPAWSSTTPASYFTTSQQTAETSYAQDGQNATSYTYPTYATGEQQQQQYGYASYGYGYAQQGNDSYSQNVGPYASSGAAYQPASYPSSATYYNNGVYQQQPGAYQGTATAYTGAAWNSDASNTSGNTGFVNYGSYPGYVAPASQYQQPGSYYSGTVQQVTETAGPPGAEASVAAAPVDGNQVPASTYASVVAQGYTAGSQPPPPGTQWQSQAVPANGHSQWNASGTSNQASYQQARPPVPQTAPYKPQPPLPFHHKSPVKIQMNPRMPQVLQTDASHRPAYLSVGAKKPSEADSSFKPGMFPPSLRAYVERALARCKDDSQKAVCQQMMKEIITKASSDGTLFSKNWDVEPLFPLPNANADGKGEQVLGTTKKTKSRWEPVLPSTDTNTSNLQNDMSKINLLNQPKQSGSVGSMSWIKRDTPWTKSKTFLPMQLPTQLSAQTPQQPQQQQQQQQQQLQQQTQQLPQPFGQTTKPFKASGKRPRKSTSNAESDGSSETDADKDLGGVTLGTITSEANPEEKKRRQTRSKRFESTKNVTVAVKTFPKGKMPGGISASTRRASALRIASSYGDGSAQAVEDIDWDSLTIRGSCQEIEKRYLRLTSAPDPATVRPEEVLVKALEMVKSTTKNYFYKCEQLKSIRQDLTVQRIRNEFAVQVYEAHARTALESGDLAEYNQCQTQLKTLYAEGIRGCCNEFAAYSLLYIVFQNGSNRDLVSSIARLSLDAKEDEAVAHALAVRKSVALENYVLFFRLYKSAPNLNSYLMDLYVEKMRFEALRCMSRAIRPTLPLDHIARVLGFMNGQSVDKDELDECEEWVKAHGGQVVAESSGERQFDTKASSTSLFMPDPEDAVAHGDASLAVNDFLTRATAGG